MKRFAWIVLSVVLAVAVMAMPALALDDGSGVTAAAGLTLDKRQVMLDLNGGEAAVITATVTPADTTDPLTWTSSDASVVTVENGSLTALKEGTVTITATVGSYSETCAVTVTCSHALAPTAALAPTCDAGGNNAYYTCSACGKVFKDDSAVTQTTVEAEQLPALGHVYGEGWLSDDTGHWRKCEACQTVTDRTAHEYTWVTDKAATEEATGLKHEECVCGKKRSENTVIDKLDHVHRDIRHNEAVAATCQADGRKESWTCGACGKLFADEGCTTETTEAELVVKAGGHQLSQVAAKAPGCEEPGTAAHYACATCGKCFTDAEGTTETTAEALAIAPTGHSLTKNESKAATCDVPGNITYWNCGHCSKIFADAGAEIETTEEKVFSEPLGHNYDDGRVTTEPTIGKPGVRTYTCTACGAKKTEEIPQLENSNVIRIAGDNRCETAYKAADALKEALDVDSFDTIIIASGNEFADALAGSYLAAVKNAPILLYRKGFEEDNRAYIAENLSRNGRVYILGGTAAVPRAMEDVLDGFDVVRLEGKNRYVTNLAILEEAGVAGDRILVGTGMAFADCLAASATGLPILMVNSRADKLTDEQVAFLKENSGKKLTIIGGTAAISEKLAKELAQYGTVDRISGERREETAVAVAEAFFPAVKTVVVAYSRNFPDALCGGPLAYALDCPLLLVSQNTASYAAGYLAENGVTAGYVMGGSAVISSATVNAVFGE